MPHSQNVTCNDKIQYDLSLLNRVEIIATKKVVGKNVTLYRDFYQIKGDKNFDCSYIDKLHKQVKGNIPPKFRICGQLNTQHNKYLVFNIWENNKCLSWKDTQEYCELLGLTCVPVLWRGLYDISNITFASFNTLTREGYVIRPSSSFLNTDFNKVVISNSPLDVNCHGIIEFLKIYW